MWTSLRQEIEIIRKQLSIPVNEFHAVCMHEGEDIEKKIYSSFCQYIYHGVYPAWLREHFKLETHTATHDQPYLYLDKIIDNKEKVWCFFNETVRDKTKLMQR